MKSLNKPIQELFDKMWKGLEGQGWRRSTTSQGECKYDNGAGLRCAVGHCIPQKRTRDRLDNFSGSSIIELTSSGKMVIESPKVLNFLKDAQREHDCCKRWLYMKERFTWLAEEYNLTIPNS